MAEHTFSFENKGGQTKKVTVNSKVKKHAHAKAKVRAGKGWELSNSSFIKKGGNNNGRNYPVSSVQKNYYPEKREPIYPRY